MKNTAQKAGGPMYKRIGGEQTRRRLSRAAGSGFDAQSDTSPKSSDHAMLRWLNLAVRYHSARHADVIVAFKTVAGPDVADGLPALYVWEVAHCCQPKGMQWAFIVWDVTGFGVRFRDCADRDEAMALYALPTEQGIAAVQVSPGVYLRRAAQPA